MKSAFILASAFVLCSFLSKPASSAFSSGSTGTDGAFHPITSTLIDLTLAGTGSGTGGVDSAHGAIVFNYTTIQVDSGITVTFKRHPLGLPVVWLASGDVTINGTVDVSGANGIVNDPNDLYSNPGPGGFQGGRAMSPNGNQGGSGLGPGGGNVASASAGGGGFGTPGSGASGTGGGTYGNIQCLPLIGGSGGAAGYLPGWTGGGGGGAILLASSGNIVMQLRGIIKANGGNPAVSGGGGSGGAIRLIANNASGPGALRAIGGTFYSGGNGRIRVEAFNIDLPDTGIPKWTLSTAPGPVFPDPSAPTLRATFVDGTPVPLYPYAGIATTDVLIADTAAVTINIDATNIPPGTTVKVFIIPDGGLRTSVTSTPLSGDLAHSTATAAAIFPNGKRCEVFLKANF